MGCICPYKKQELIHFDKKQSEDLKDFNARKFYFLKDLEKHDLIIERCKKFEQIDDCEEQFNAIIVSFF